ncbi:hypothetical protein ACH4U6_34540 [Streptomyces netropsis]
MNSTVRRLGLWPLTDINPKRCGRVWDMHASASGFTSQTADFAGF